MREWAWKGNFFSIYKWGCCPATKTGILLQAAVRRQGLVFYQPIDVSKVSLDTAREYINQGIPGVTVLPQLSNYVIEPIQLERHAGTKALLLYIGSGIINFLKE